MDAAIEEDVQGVAVSSYQGGHVEYFEYLVESLRERGAGHVQVVGGGGGVIVHDEIERLRACGVTIFSPEDGQRLGLAGMINSVVADCDFDLWDKRQVDGGRRHHRRPGRDRPGDHRRRGGQAPAGRAGRPHPGRGQAPVPVLGITGTGGSGKSSLTDELVRRFRIDQQDKLRIAVIAVDPTRRKGGGALLGDRIRMNSPRRRPRLLPLLATRGAHELPDHLADVITVLKAAGFDLVIVETPGIGQGDAAIVPFVDTSLYVMTPEFGAASQLEKIDMLDFADVVAINKFERRGAEDALRDVGRQLVRNREAFGKRPEDMPVFGTSAATFNDDGVTALYQHLARAARRARPAPRGRRPAPRRRAALLEDPPGGPVRPGALPRRDHRDRPRLPRRAPTSWPTRPAGCSASTRSPTELGCGRARAACRRCSSKARERRSTARRVEAARRPGPPSSQEYAEHPGRESLSGNRIPRVSLPAYADHGELVRFWRRENLPGCFPFTAGVFPFKREDEDPARMFAGEGDPSRTNRRFKLLSEGQPATRLSTAFDSVTLYGRDPDQRPDIYGKVGTSGVSVATLDDMKELYDGFDLLAPTTSVSHDDQRPGADGPGVLPQHRDRPGPRARASTPRMALAQRPRHGAGRHPQGGPGPEHLPVLHRVLAAMMADIQEWFIEKEVRNFYSVSISGYHIAEAGANPISQLAFTLANGFTYVEAYLARGMDIDDFAPNLSFFFSNGMDPEYSVLGRVARRIWAVAMREKYGANERSQKLKYHVQTTGRSLHAQEMDFNDIRTTLQALIAIYDNANSLHTNAYDEAVTTPSTESVRRALAIQLIINREWGLAMNENPLQGSFVIDELTDLVEEAVLAEFDAINERGGVLGAMETGYQRGRIQDESMLYEHRKHDGSLPIIGVNTFRRPGGDDGTPDHVELARATETEKESQLHRVHAFQDEHEQEATAALARLKEAAVSGDNVFAVLMDAARVCSLGQVTEAFFEVGGQYRRNV